MEEIYKRKMEQLGFMLIGVGMGLTMFGLFSDQPLLPYLVVTLWFFIFGFTALEAVKPFKTRIKYEVKKR